MICERICNYIYIIMNIEESIKSMEMLKDEAIAFVTVKSDLYPDLEKYYEQQKSVWSDEIILEVYGDEDEDG